jgi:hypothetical protein
MITPSYSRLHRLPGAPRGDVGRLVPWVEPGPLTVRAQLGYNRVAPETARNVSKWPVVPYVYPRGRNRAMHLSREKDLKDGAATR